MKESKLIIEGKEVELLPEQVEAFKKKFGINNNVIMVPDGIHINHYGGWGINFNNDKQHLYYDNQCEIYKVVECSHHLEKYKLVKVKEKNLKVGRIYFHTSDDSVDTSSTNLRHYCIYIGNGECIYPNNREIVLNKEDWNYWYEVQELDED